jgi:hypothetical protein
MAVLRRCLGVLQTATSVKRQMNAGMFKGRD